MVLAQGPISAAAYFSSVENGKHPDTNVLKRGRDVENVSLHIHRSLEREYRIDDHRNSLSSTVK